ncbi:NAD(P)/FAD-dependent oxidoreductase [Pseudomonas sp. BGr12]|uniref:NAD(P)/FAD-dependent oxidoreductase n=1 Tax=Pseudomonas sp. BGr12 TaxID=2936269 RepID=UPI00255A256B|nr:NAD(P)/FAD-dependent oxidoreductase [Pseudomonas sp. BJa5]MDL2428406.1 NAD(P)/FAD-dependent oxidoreductase [Pseudomonas sp. BJa5]
MTNVKRVVIVGAGFGGLATAKGLAGKACHVTLVDRTNHHLFQPLLYQVATASLSPADIAGATRTITRAENIRVLMDEVTGVNTSRNIVETKLGENLPYDYLVLATGADYSFFGNDQWRPHAPVLKTLEDAISIREKLLGNLEKAERSSSAGDVQQLLTFVVVGAGPTGVEMAGAIAELTKTALAKDFKRIELQQVRILLVEAGSRVLSVFPMHLSDYAHRALEVLGVEVKLGEAVSDIDATGLTVGRERIASKNIIWCAGTQARPAGDWIHSDVARNRAVKVQGDCSVPNHPNIFAIGDVASFSFALKSPLPGLAPVAKQQGQYVAKVIQSKIAGLPPIQPFSYKNWGTMAVIGRSHAVADFGKIRLKGYVAWLAWSLVHLMLLIDFRSRTSVYLNWSWAWFTRGRAARHLLTACDSEPQRSADNGVNTSQMNSG